MGYNVNRDYGLVRRFPNALGQPQVEQQDIYWSKHVIISADKEGLAMSSTAIATVIKMMESVPEAVQDQVVDCASISKTCKTNFNGIRCLRKRNHN